MTKLTALDLAILIDTLSNSVGLGDKADDMFRYKKEARKALIDKLVKIARETEVANEK